MKIAILGGTGKEGSGLGFRWAAAGHEIIIGSRSEEKGIQAAAELQAALPDAVIRGCDNVTAADEAEIVVLSVPYEAQQATLTDVRAVLQGKLLITVVAPLGQPKARAVRLSDAGNMAYCLHWWARQPADPAPALLLGV